MNLDWIDWTVVIIVTVFFMFTAWYTRRFVRSVADFMAANRCAGRYLLAVAYGISSLGAITIIAELQKFYKAGFTAVWWSFMYFVVSIIIAATGWTVYRYRETRSFTLGQFFEIRYSKKFRIFAGILGFAAGVINFGIFPAIGAQFFMHFCGLPAVVSVAGIQVSVFMLTILILLSVSLFFTFIGGQIAVIVTDFLQGVFCNIVFFIMLVVLYKMFNWSTILEGLRMASAEQSRLNPFHTGGISDYNVWFFLILAFSWFYGVISWQGQQGYFCSAKSPHEQKMAMILAQWRFVASTLLLVLLAVIAFVVMNHPDYTFIADKIKLSLNAIENKQVRDQMNVPLVLLNILPKWMIGAFCAAMLAAFISTHDTYLHTWGSIFIQDVVIPLRKTPLSPKQHMSLLRASIVGVAVFVFTWSMLFRQSQDILMYFQITGAIFMGGVGSAIIGGLYWKRGTTTAAWIGMITGGFLATLGVVLIQMHDQTPFNNKILAFIASCNGAVLGFWASVAAIIVYIVVSLLGKKQSFNLDKMLHRGEYAIKNNSEPELDLAEARGLKSLIGGKEFTFCDKTISTSMIVWGIGWFLVFMAGMIYNGIHEISEDTWANFWSIYVWISLIVGAIITIWFSIGGLLNLKQMFKTLATMKRNSADDGTVINHHNLDEK